MRLGASLALVLLLDMATASAADMEVGARAYQKCYACHALDPAETGLQGPNLHDVIGRRAAALADFEYSSALTALGKSGVIWSEESLDRFLADPQAFAPGNAMGFFGMADPAVRAAVIAYIKHATGE